MRQSAMCLKMFIILFGFSLYFTQCWAQKTVKIDFLNRQVSNPDVLNTLSRGDFFVVEVGGINLNLYRVSIGKVDSTTAKALPVPNYSNLSITDISSIVNSLSPIGGIVSALSEQIDKQARSAFARSSEAIQEYMLEKKIADTKAEALNSVVQQEKERIQKVLKEIGDVIGSEQEFIGQRCDSLKRIKESVRDVFFHYDGLIVASALDLPHENQVEVEEFSIPNLYDFVKYSIDRLDSLYWQISHENRKYNKLVSPYVQEMNTNTALKPVRQAHDSLVRCFTNLSKLVDGESDSLASQSTLGYVKNLAAISNNIGATYRSLPLQYNGDAESITINITPQSTGSALMSYNTQIVFPTEHRDFWGISSGFYYASLPNNSYSFKKIVKSGADTVFALTDEKAAYAEFGFNAMMRYGTSLWGSDSWYLQAGIGPGIAVSDKIRPRMMVGLGFAYGKGKHKLLFDLLAQVFGYTNYLSNTYKAGEEFKIAPSGGTTVSKMRNAFSMSVSYIFY